MTKLAVTNMFNNPGVAWGGGRIAFKFDPAWTDGINRFTGLIEGIYSPGTNSWKDLGGGTLYVPGADIGLSVDPPNVEISGYLMTVTGVQVDFGNTTVWRTRIVASAAGVWDFNTNGIPPVIVTSPGLPAVQVTMADVLTTIATQVPAATDSVQGKIEIATNAETLAFADATRATTPANLGAVRNVANGIAGLGADNLLPALRTRGLKTWPGLISQTAMLALAATAGDQVVRADDGKTYRLNVEPATTLANWEPVAEKYNPATKILAAGSIELGDTDGSSANILSVRPVALNQSRMYLMPRGAPTGNVVAALKIFDADFRAQQESGGGALLTYRDLGLYYDAANDVQILNTKRTVAGVPSTGAAVTNLSIGFQDAPYIDFDFALGNPGIKLRRPGAITWGTSLTGATNYPSIEMVTAWITNIGVSNTGVLRVKNAPFVTEQGLRIMGAGIITGSGSGVEHAWDGVTGSIKTVNRVTNAFLPFLLQASTIQIKGLGSTAATTLLQSGTTGLQLTVDRTTTAARPTGIPAGTHIFDTTLVKPIWYDGAVWKDATGATV